MEDIEEGCNIELGLGLGLGVGEFLQKSNQQKGKPAVGLDLTLQLNPTEGRESRTPESKEYEDERKRRSSDFRNSDNEYTKRKKLKLTKEQSNSLEQSFKLRTTLNPTQKQELADQLNLLPRQVEVWFQNRRARTKSKQTETDLEFLKRCCQSIEDENLRLKRELHVLKLEQKSLLYVQLTKKDPTTLMMRSSCERCLKTETKPANDLV